MQEQSRYSTLNRGLRSDWCRTNWHMIILIYKSLAVATLRFAAKLHRWTSVSETIRNPPLVKPKLHLKKQNKKIYRKTICNMADGILSYCNVPRGSGITCQCIRQNVRNIGILLLVWISTISPQSTCHSAPVCEILSKLDRRWHYCHVDFQEGGRRQLGF